MTVWLMRFTTSKPHMTQLRHALAFAVDGKIMQSHLAAIRHARWFEENAQHSRYIAEPS